MVLFVPDRPLGGSLVGLRWFHDATHTYVWCLGVDWIALGSLERVDALTPRQWTPLHAYTMRASMSPNFPPPEL